MSKHWNTAERLIYAKKPLAKNAGLNILEEGKVFMHRENKGKLFEKEEHEYNPQLSPSVWTKYLRLNVAIKIGLHFYYVLLTLTDKMGKS